MGIKGLKERILAEGEDKLIEKSNQADIYAREKVIKAIMEDTGCSYEETMAACTGPDGVRVPE